MKDLLESLKELENLTQVLEPNEAERQKLQKVTHQFSSSFIDKIEQTPTYSNTSPSSSKLELNNTSSSIEELLTIYQDEVVQHGLNPASGGHLGYIPGGGLYASALADYLADVTNEYAGMKFGSPGAVAMEEEALTWMKKLFGFPKTAVGNLTSGGSIANLIALTAARDKHGIKNQKVSESVIYLSAHVHHCIQKAIRIIGLEDIIIRYINLDEYHRMDPNDLKENILEDQAKGLNPFLVVASAGTTDAGAIDPLDLIADISKEHNLWYHVDGAYGGFFILTDSKKDRFKGIERADSLVIDPHKGLFLPYGLGAVLVKDKEAVFHSHHYTANYMQDANKEDSVINPADVSPELTKHFRGPRMWLPLRLYGTEVFKHCLEEKLLLTHYFRQQLENIGFKLGPEPDLSVSYFWYPKKENENQFNQKLMEELHKDGSVFLSSTSLNGKFVIRMAILAFRTKKHTIDKAIKMIQLALERLN